MKNLTITLILLATTFCSQAQKGGDTIIPNGGVPTDDGTKTTTETPCQAAYPNADQSTAIKLCNTNAYVCTALGNKGTAANEIAVQSSNLVETHTTWLQFTADQASSMTFTIKPSSPNDDIDFVLYKKNTLNRWDIVRAATNGPMMGGQKPAFYQSNLTGMQKGDTDFFTADGGILKSNSDNDGFVAALNTSAGDEFLLGINNFYACNGFRLDWNGNFTIKPCPIGTNISSKVAANIGVTLSDVYPNPSDNLINLDLDITTQPNERTTTSDAIVTDILGRPLAHTTVEPQNGQQRISFDTVTFAPGTYQVQIIINGLPYVRKFIVER